MTVFELLIKNVVKCTKNYRFKKTPFLCVDFVY